MEITFENICNAHNLISKYIHRTPVLTSKSINEICGCELFFKCENFQKIGAFKIRGALNAALTLPESKLKNGICTHSSGNHAQAIAYAAKILGIKAYIVMPDNSPKVKTDAVKGYGAEIFFCEPTLQAREDNMKKVIDKTNAEFIHPYDDYRIITGQATCAKELLEEIADLDAIITPVGGGGLLSGTLLSANYISPKTEVFAAEPEGAADAIYSIKSGKIEKAKYIDTIADGLLTTLGTKNFEIIKKYIKGIILVSDIEIIESLKIIFQRLKIVVEPSSVTALAAIIKQKDYFQKKKIGVILSGGNIDTALFASIFKD